MPTTFKVAAHGPVPVEIPQHPTSAQSFLNSVLRSNSAAKEILQSSLEGIDAKGFADMHVRKNGFVYTVVKAYNEHHHLVIRPDDVWIAILGQFNFYVNAHAEELRSAFVTHEGKKTLTVTAVGNRYTVDFGGLANQMTKEIEKNVVDKDLKDWVLPQFSTTTHTDIVVCAVLMMATLKNYFDYRMELLCGIPSVTLEGSKEDWENILSRIDKLETFGAEPKVWAAMLRPILKRFVSAFDGNPDVDFWSRVCDYHSYGSGPTYYSGWITAFCVWSSQGKWQGPTASGPQKQDEPEDIPALSLDGAHYTFINSNDVPPSHCEVDVELDDNGEIFDCTMVSGHMGSIVRGEKKDMIQPLPAWFMYIKGQSSEEQNRW